MKRFAAVLLPLASNCPVQRAGVHLILALCLFAAWLRPAYAQLPYPLQTFTVGASSPNPSGSYSGNVTSGNLLVCALTAVGGSPTGISDTRTTTWTQRAAVGNSTNGFAWVWSGAAPSSGADTVTITGSFTNPTVLCGEYVAVTNTVDATNTGTFSGTPATLTTSAITTTVSGDMIFTVLEDNSGGGTNIDVTSGTPLSGQEFCCGVGIASATSLTPAGNPGNYTASFAINGASGVGAYAMVAFKASSSLAIANTGVPQAIVNQAYSYQLVATDGVSPFTWTTTGGTIPAGMTLNSSTGLLSGTPTSGVSSSNVTFKVTDSGANSATKTLTLSLNNGNNIAALVQFAGGSLTNAVQTSGNVNSGDLMVVVLFGENTVNAFYLPPPPTDTLGTVYSPAHAIETNSANVQMHVWTGTLPSGGVQDQVNNPIGANGVFGIVELRNVQVFVDIFNSTVGVSGTTDTSNSLTVPTPNDMLLSFANIHNSTATVTANSPFTNLTFVGATGTGGGYDVVSAAQGYTVSYTTNSSVPWAILLDAFRPTGNGVQPPVGGVRHYAQVE